LLVESWDKIRSLQAVKMNLSSLLSQIRPRQTVHKGIVIVVIAVVTAAIVELAVVADNYIILVL
jgi:hypothetical protein